MQTLLSNTLVTKETLSCYPVDLKEQILYKMTSQSIKLWMMIPNQLNQIQELDQQIIDMKNWLVIRKLLNRV